jgi:hypothetical protein
MTESVAADFMAVTLPPPKFRYAMKGILIPFFFSAI